MPTQIPLNKLLHFYLHLEDSISIGKIASGQPTKDGYCSCLSHIFSASNSFSLFSPPQSNICPSCSSSHLLKQLLTSTFWNVNNIFLVLILFDLLVTHDTFDSPPGNALGLSNAKLHWLSYLVSPSLFVEDAFSSTWPDRTQNFHFF